MEAIGSRCVPVSRLERTAGHTRALFLLMKPGIVAAVVLTGFAGMVVSGRGLPATGTTLAAMATLLLSAAGSAMLNNLFDLPLDRRMVRLTARVDALERFGANRLLLTALACIGSALFLAASGINRLTFLLTLAAILCYTVLYTLRLKRRSPWGAIPGGLPGALPVLIGQAAASGTIDRAGLLLFAVVLLWQPPHFWLLALRCTDDYRAAALPVLPLVHGERCTRWMIVLFVGSLLPATLSFSAIGACSGLFALWAVLSWGYFLHACCRHAVQANRFDRAFRASIVYLAALLLGVIVDIAR